MSKEYIILVVAWVITGILLIIFVPKNKIRQASIIFLFKQLMTWFFGLIVVELRWIEYPGDVLQYASKTSFTFEYLVYPAICVLFNLHYKEENSTFNQLKYYFYFCTVITLIEVTLESTTELINYINWSWYWTWITLFITFYASRRFYLWFFRPYTDNTVKQKRRML